ncbi:ArsC/Spx/MgsR family protein [Deinococcus peraridilitoris]|uniref:Glutaredoxin family protein, arsenate reductase n=1 Tax=Deinococcus peraridilitoris (strain DSM 19664 / LMG 22246 / CIP 109416 / KR-200) TaxID=937777 RepID=L0A2T8_DEIPD|nr:ArsC/Spx/MgsR family protein [Deinococcus peraridilitoris]AFZ68198.1 glutaredoxin family protein, arsenate reductase [Deinococcus peraridilitoris DSM 19664]
MEVQIFGLKKSSSTRAAERFFKERRVKIHFVDLRERPIAKGELARFTQKFGLTALLDVEGQAYEKLNLPYLRLSEEGLMQRAITHPEILRLPLVRLGKHLSYGQNPEAWAAMVQG